MDETVQPVDARHKAWKGHEELLHWEFPKHVQLLFNFDQLQRVSASDVHSAFDECDSSECTAELVDLW